jgi:hypothetical protein
MSKPFRRKPVVKFQAGHYEAIAKAREKERT